MTQEANIIQPSDDSTSTSKHPTIKEELPTEQDNHFAVPKSRTRSKSQIGKERERTKGDATTIEEEKKGGEETGKKKKRNSLKIIRDALKRHTIHLGKVDLFADNNNTNLSPRDSEKKNAQEELSEKKNKRRSLILNSYNSFVVNLKDQKMEKKKKHLEMVKMKGFLQKRSDILHIWKKKYCAIFEDKIHIYSSEDKFKHMKNPEISLRLPMCSIDEEYSFAPEREFVFSITAHGRTVHFQAPDKVSMVQWIEIVRDIIHQRFKL